LAVLASSRRPVAQSLTYSKGQNVSPAFEGWQTRDDGSSSFVFGYMNANWDEEVNVPIGPDNTFGPAGADAGQPTHFLPNRNRFAFRVPVPPEFGSQELVWTLTSHGVTEKAYASLRADYFIDDIVIASETGALGPGATDPTVRANRPPSVTVEGGKTRQVRVNQPLALVAQVTDDGIPKAPGQGEPLPTAADLARLLREPPRRITVEKSLGLHLSWFVYRGEGRVTFDPLQVKVWEDTRVGANSPWAPLWVAPPLPVDNRWMAQARFDTPGNYVLRARADDGGLLADADVSVMVTK
jgi:hypothetical protein